jgi:hypothetical protein
MIFYAEKTIVGLSLILIIVCLSSNILAISIGNHFISYFFGAVPFSTLYKFVSIRLAALQVSCNIYMHWNPEKY